MHFSALLLGVARDVPPHIGSDHKPVKFTFLHPVFLRLILMFFIPDELWWALVNTRIYTGSTKG
jgi:hypothetical protein